MIPIGHDRQVTRRLPLITITLIALNFLIFIAQATVAPQQDASLDTAFEKLLAYSLQHPQAKITPEAHDRLSRIPDKQLQLTRLKLEVELGIRTTRDAYPILSLSEAELMKQETQRLSAAFVSAYDENWNLKFGFIPYTHKNSPLNYLTNIFMHGGWEHLLGNMICLFVVGIALEDTWGGLFYLLFYLLSGFVATGTHAYSAPDSKVVCIGASGAIAGTMGAFLVRHFKSRIKLFIFVAIVRVPAYIYLPFILALDLKNSFRDTSDELGGVAFWAHIGGFFFGAVGSFIVYYSGFEKFLAPKKNQRARSFGTGSAVREAQEHLRQSEIEEALRKLKQRLEVVPNDAQALQLLAATYAAAGQRQLEISTCHRLIKIYLQEKRLEDALQAYSALLDSYAEEEIPHRLAFRDWNLLCDYLRDRGMWREAAGEYEKLAQAYPGDILAARMLAAAGDCRERLGEYDYARELHARSNAA